jgi:hypothetical protein
MDESILNIIVSRLIHPGLQAGCILKQTRKPAPKNRSLWRMRLAAKWLSKDKSENPQKLANPVASNNTSTIMYHMCL